MRPARSSRVRPKPAPLKPVDVSKPDHSPVPIGSPGSRGDGVLEPAAEERAEDLA